MRLKTLRLPSSGPLLGAGYLLLWLLLQPTVQPYWMLPYGLRFGALLLTPVRRWGWLLGAELVATTGINLLQHVPLGWESFIVQHGPGPLVMAGGLWVLRRFNVHASLNRPQDVSRFLLSALLVIMATTAVDAAMLTVLHTAESSEVMARELGQHLLTHYLSILLIVPIMIMPLRTSLKQWPLSKLIKDGLLVLLPAMIVLLALSARAAPQPQFARVLSLALVLFFAFHHGWRGASLAMIISSLGMTMVDRQLGLSPSTATDYLFLAVAGTGAIMLGSATDALRRTSARVAEQNVRLATVNHRLDQLAHQLRGAARGNLRTDENLRRYLAAELHDELGQNITAIQTHVKLAQARLLQSGLEEISTSINAILAHMRRALHRLLDDLRPAVLDEFGLLRALDEGPIRDLLHAAGMTYRSELHGDPHLLDDDTRTAIYRLAQESATNAVKHARASEFRLRLRIGERQGIAMALLYIRDNGTGLPGRLPRAGRGLQGMRDRVTSLGGQFRLRSDAGHTGVHLRILLRSNIDQTSLNRTN
ncbi:MAG: MASE1 domain-containing protein [Rhodanobacter sp.]|jgi:two-component system sensor histidine kinase UhpB|nr:MASE1 domain-containing protein [Rhodanobacter sp.]